MLLSIIIKNTKKKKSFRRFFFFFLHFWSIIEDDGIQLCFFRIRYIQKKKNFRIVPSIKKLSVKKITLDFDRNIYIIKKKSNHVVIAFLFTHCLMWRIFFYSLSLIRLNNKKGIYKKMLLYTTIRNSSLFNGKWRVPFGSICLLTCLTHFGIMIRLFVCVCVCVFFWF